MLSLTIPAIKKIEQVAQNRKGCISFSQGALRLGGVHPDIKEYARQISLSDKADYYQDSLGIMPLRKKIAETLNEADDIHLGVEQIAITHGSMGALSSLCLAILKAGDEVLLPEPTYPVYTHVVTIAKGKPIFVPAWHLGLEGKNTLEWKFNVNAIEKAITQNTKMIIISHPSNPTGSYLSKLELVELARLCESKGIYLVVDEIYDDFIFEGTFYSSSSLAAESDRVVRVGSFSKNFAMSGWRTGYLIGSKQLVSVIGAVQIGTINCPTIISQYAALFGLEHKEEIVGPYYKQLDHNRNIMCDFFDALQKQGEIVYAKPTSGFYLFFKTNHQDSTSFVLDILDKANVALVPGADFGNSCHAYVRLCFARDFTLVAEGICRLQDYFMQKQRSNTMSLL